jgi:hypothetical protein
LFIVDLDRFHEAANDFPTGVHVGLGQPLPDLSGKVVQAAKHQAKFGSLRSTILSHGRFALETIKPLSRLSHAWLEFTFLQQALFVGIDQATDTPLRRGDLLAALFQVDVGFRFSRKTPLEFALQVVRVLQERADIGPYGGIEPIQPHRFALADRRTSETISIAAEAAIVGIGSVVVLGIARNPFAVEGVSAGTALQDSLQEIARPVLVLSGPLTVLGHLLGNGGE